MFINKERLFKQFFTKVNDDRTVKYLVLHHIGGYDSIFDEDIKDVNTAIQALKKHQVSSHYIIDVNGKIFQLVEENNIAHHAGHSYWRGEKSLNKSSIGIEFFNSNPDNKTFDERQIKSGIELCRDITSRYNIEPINIVGHSDIAYFEESKENEEKGISYHLNRKDDPSHLFDWDIFAENNVGLYHKINDNFEDKILFKIGDKTDEVTKLKQSLAEFGYKIMSLDNVFDKQLNSVVRVFNRRFNKKVFLEDNNCWNLSSDVILNQLLKL